jgi:hypothetical protein
MSATARLMAALGLDTSQFTRGLDGAKTQAGSFEKSFISMGKSVAGAFGIGAGIAGMVSLGKRAVEAATEIDRGAKVTRLSAEQFQTFGDAIEESGGKAEGLIAVMTKIKDAQGQVDSGNKTVAKSLESAGISAEAFASAGADKALLMLAQAGERASWTGKEFSAVADIIGVKQLPELQEALSSLATNGWDKLTAAMRASGEMMDSATVKSLVESRQEIQHVNDSVTALSGKVLALTRHLLALPSRLAFGLSEGEGPEEITMQDARRMARNAKDLYDRKQAAKEQARAEAEAAAEAAAVEKRAPLLQKIMDEQERREDLTASTDEKIERSRNKQIILEGAAILQQANAEAHLAAILDLERERTNEATLRKQKQQEETRELEKQAKLEQDRARAVVDQRKDRFERGASILERIGAFATREPELAARGGQIGADRGAGLRPMFEGALRDIRQQIDEMNRSLNPIAGT